MAVNTRNINGVLYYAVWVGNENSIRLTGLQNQDSNQYVNGASPMLTIFDADNAQVAGSSWPIIGNYVASSDGDYFFTIPDTVQFVAGESYTAIVDAEDILTNTYHAEVPLIAETRTN